jgi:hypothetical protein
MTTGLYTGNTELQPTAEIIKRTNSLSKAKKRWVWCSRWRWKFGALIRLLGPVREGLLSGCFSRFLPHDTLTMQLKLSPRVKAADMARTSGSQVPSIRELQMRSIIRSPVALVKVNNNLRGTVLPSSRLGMETAMQVLGGSTSKSLYLRRWYTSGIVDASSQTLRENSNLRYHLGSQNKGVGLRTVRKDKATAEHPKSGNASEIPGHDDADPRTSYAQWRMQATVQERRCSKFSGFDSSVGASPTLQLAIL